MNLNPESSMADTKLRKKGGKKQKDSILKDFTELCNESLQASGAGI
jgi:hypothetical protein